LLYDREHYPDYWDRVTGFFRDHHLQAKVAGEFDGVSSLTAALEGNLGIALLATSSPMNHGQKQRLIARLLAEEPRPIQVAAGVSAEIPTSPQVLAFIEELKHAASES
jgi:DNA-binding transcriptional LysR family regulator